MSRYCPLCQKSPREGELMERVRLHPGDLSPANLQTLKRDTEPEPGLYHVCGDCLALVKPAIVARLNDGRREEALKKGEAAPEPYTPETVPANWLI